MSNGFFFLHLVLKQSDCIRIHVIARDSTSFAFLKQHPNDLQRYIYDAKLNITEKKNRGIFFLPSSAARFSLLFVF